MAYDFDNNGPDQWSLRRPRIDPPRMPDPAFVPAEPRTRIPLKPIGDQPLVTEVAFLAALVEAVEVLENEAAHWKDMFDTLALGIKVTAEARDYSRAESELAEARKGLCWDAYLQDERCKLPAGHIGAHGPKHLCDIDCGLSPDGCTLPVPANPAAYWKALYWELHGYSCAPTCRGHDS